MLSDDEIQLMEAIGASGSLTRAAASLGKAPSSVSYTLRQIEGSMPRLGAIPAGCAFNPRCGAATARCREERPTLDGTAHAAACWHPVTEPAHA